MLCFYKYKLYVEWFLSCKVFENAHVGQNFHEIRVFDATSFLNIYWYWNEIAMCIQSRTIVIIQSNYLNFHGFILFKKNKNMFSSRNFLNCIKTINVMPAECLDISPIEAYFVKQFNYLLYCCFIALSTLLYKIEMQFILFCISITFIAFNSSSVTHITQLYRLCAIGSLAS